MTSTFTPNTTLSPETNPKDVGYLLGQLAETDSICFTRASLINFLKVQGVEVDTHYSQLRRLPKYATFGRLTEAAPQQQQQAAPAAAASATSPAAAPAASAAASRDEYLHNPAVKDADGNAFKPTRRVREAIGGGSAQIHSLFGGDDDEPLRETAPARTNVAPSAPAAAPSAAAPASAPAPSARSVSSSSNKYSEFEPSTGVYDADGNAFKPTRRVREAIGGGSEQIASLFGGGGDDDDYENRPSSGRRRRCPSFSTPLHPSPLRSSPELALAPIRPIRRRRGAFIVVEGLDRAGKSTQVEMLAEWLRAQRRGGAATAASSSASADADTNVVVMKFPDRTTRIGTLINAYLTSDSRRAAPLPPRAIHLLFAANRWELAQTLREHLAAGRDVVADRYAFSGVAYALATTPQSSESSSGSGEGSGEGAGSGGGESTQARLATQLAFDAGLPAPDLTLFLSLRPETAAARGGYGEERFEREEVQRRVRSAFGLVEGVVTRRGGPEVRRATEGRADEEVEGRATGEEGVPEGGAIKAAESEKWRTIAADSTVPAVFDEVKRAVEGVVRRLEEVAASGSEPREAANVDKDEEGGEVAQAPPLGTLW